jgi:hypothetical protein
VYLWTRAGEPPPEYLRYRLRMMYGLSPSQLEREARGEWLFEMLRDLRCASVGARAEKQRLDLTTK